MIQLIISRPTVGSWVYHYLYRKSDLSEYWDVGGGVLFCCFVFCCLSGEATSEDTKVGLLGI